MAVLGKFAQRARAQFPITWDHLLDSKVLGEQEMQDIVDDVKERVFGSVISLSQEETYPRRVQEYVGKIIALSLIPAGLDFWANQQIAVSGGDPARGGAAEWLNRSNELRELRNVLLEETRAMEPEILGLLGLTYNRPIARRKISVVSEKREGWLTPDPFGFPAQSLQPGEEEEF